MGEILLTAMVMLLALYGCAQGVRWLSGRLLSDGRRQALLVLPLSGVCEDAEYRIRSCLYTAQAEHLTLWVLDDGLEPESRTLVEQMCARLSGVRLCCRADWVGAVPEAKLPDATARTE